MSITWKWLVQLLVAALEPILKVLTPTIAQSLKDLLTELYIKAQKTDSPWDDYLIGFLLDILAIPRPPPS